MFKLLKNKRNKNDKENIIKNRIIAIILAIPCLLGFVASVFETYRIKNMQAEIINADNQYKIYVNAHLRMRKGSDDLTAEARTYSATGNFDYLDGYFKEINEDKDRDFALELLEKNDRYDVKTHMEEAKTFSDELCIIEYRAMYLRLYADKLAGTITDEKFNEKNSRYPVLQQSLTAEDTTCLAGGDATEIYKHSIDILFDQTYQTLKHSIWEKTDKLLEEAIEKTDNDIKKLNSKQVENIKVQTTFMICSLVASIGLLALILLRTIVEMRKERQIEDINKNAAILEKKLDEAELKANIDPLTDMHTVSAYYEKMAKLRKTEKQPFIMIMCDINNLKFVNDNFGHITGNKYINNCCNVLTDVFGKDCIYRLGGDEFAIILIGEQYEKRNELIKKLKAAVKHAEALPSYNLGKASFSFGIAEYNPETKCSVEDVVAQADEEMYSAKREYKKRVNK